MMNKKKKNLVTNTSFYSSPQIPKKHNHVEIKFSKLNLKKRRKYGIFP